MSGIPTSRSGPSARSRRLALLISTAGYVGYAPVAPGTVGSAAGLLIYLLARESGVPAAVALLALLLTGLGVWSATLAEEHFGGIDPGPVVIDEVAGMLVTLIGLDLGPAGILLGFLLFRVFDVIKPYPASRLERLPGGWGIMADDVMVAAYANLVLRGVLWGWPGWGS